MSKTELDSHVSEADLQHQVEQFLTLQGWLWFHDRATNMPGAHLNPAGFPDIVAVHPRTGHVIFVELKTEKGRLTVPQLAWANALRSAHSDHSHRYLLVRPSLLDLFIKSVTELATCETHQSDEAGEESDPDS